MIRSRLAWLCLLVGCSCAFAQQPIDPLRRLEPEATQYNYNLGVQYTPSGEQALTTDETGQTVAASQAVSTLGLTLAGSYALTPNLTLYGQGNPTLSIVATQIGTQPGETISTFDSSGVVGATFAFTPGEGLDPGISVELGYPWAVASALSVSLLRDPIVLRGSAGLAKPFDEPGFDLRLGSGVGFIVNDVVDLSASTDLDLPIGRTEPANIAVGLRTGYSLDPEQNQEVGLQTTLDVKGSQVVVGLSLEFSGRGSFTAPSKDE